MILLILFSILFIIIGFILFHLIKNIIYLFSEIDNLHIKLDRLERLYYERF